MVEGQSEFPDRVVKNGYGGGIYLDWLTKLIRRWREDELTD